MKKQEFIDKLLEALELENAGTSESTNLYDIDGFDSLAVMMTIAFIDENFGKKLTGQQFASIKKMQDLMELIGLENFEN